MPNELAKSGERMLTQSTEHMLEQIMNPPGGWNISVSFGKSTSQNMERAVFLARQSPNFYEADNVYQATYSSDPSEFLQFVRLYELVSAWKSAMVAICGKPVDRKTVLGINFCYGNFCRSGDPDYCYGVNHELLNPFGCHKMRMSSYNNPWWSFGTMDGCWIWHINTEKILMQVYRQSEIYRICPEFSKEKILNGLKNIPKTIDPKVDKDWDYLGRSVTLKERASGCWLEISLDLEDLEKKSEALLAKLKEEGHKESHSTQINLELKTRQG